MASEVLYVNCQELHNSSFTPRVVSPQSGVSPGCGIQLLEATNAPDTEFTSSLANLSALADAIPDSGSEVEIALEKQIDIILEPRNPQLEAANVQYVSPPVSETPGEACRSLTSQTGNIAGGCREDIPPGPPLTLVSPTEVWRVPTRSPEIALERQNMPSRSGSHDIHSVPGVVAEHEATASTPKMFTRTHDEPYTSDQDDDVQFILSVTRKRRKKRPRLDLLPGDQGKDACVDVGKDTPMHNSNDVDQAAILNTHTVGSNVTAAQSLHRRYPGMRNSQDNSLLPSTSTGSPLATDPSSAASIPGTPKQKTRKRKRHQKSSLVATPQSPGNTNTTNTTISANTAILYRHLQPPQHVCRSGPVSRLQHIDGNELGNNNQLPPLLGSCYPLHSPSPLSRQTSTDVVQPPFPFLTGPVANATKASSASMSESLRRRPSLYAVPKWEASLPGSGMAIQTVPANAPGGIYQSTYSFRDVNLPGVSPVVPRIAEAGNVPSTVITPSGYCAHPPASQALNVQQPAGPPTIEISTSQTGLLRQSHPPNMLVDIAQTCQDNFPFVLIAKRHNQPIQKVFDTFSAVIQLPLLRSAVDARRPGKLGSLRMKEFRAMKKGLKEIPMGGQAVRKGGRKAGGKAIDSA